MRKIAARGVSCAMLGALSLASLAGATAPASAQFFGWFGPPRPIVIEREAVIPPRLVASILRAQGFRMTDMPARSGDRIIALGEDDRGQVMRFVLDAHDGAMIRSALVGAPRPPGLVGREREIVAYGAGIPTVPSDTNVFDETRAPKPKPKKTKTAAKPPAAVPTEAAPVVQPSLATRTPSAVVPLTPDVPSTTTAPERRLAPDAQPADIGPRVVPVRPTEARAPIIETTPARDASAPRVNDPVVTTSEPVKPTE